MINRFIFLLVFSLISLIQAQENNTENIIHCPVFTGTSDRIEQMAIYPGCEEFKDDNRKLRLCFQENFSKDYLKFLDTKYPPDAKNKEKLIVLLRFEVDENGKISNARIERGDDELKTQVINALNDYLEYKKSNNIKIKPAKWQNGEFKNLVINIPIALNNPKHKKEVEIQQ